MGKSNLKMASANLPSNELWEWSMHRILIKEIEVTLRKIPQESNERKTYMNKGEQVKP